MADEVRLWRIGEGDALSEVVRSRLDLESRLEDWLAKDIGVLDQKLLVIGRQVATDYGGFIDLLCINEAADLVIVELKRDRTPREITAQALDYASWVRELDGAWTTTSAHQHLGRDLEDAFRDHFGIELPETINGDHRIVIVGSEIDPSSERIIKYLSEAHGVNINAATFQYFREADGTELLARIFLIEPAAVEGRARRGSKLTYEELRALASDAGVEDLYEHALARLGSPLRKYTTRNSLGFSALLDGSNKSILSLYPRESSASDGLRFRLYTNRFGELAGLSPAEIERTLPVSRKPWLPYRDGGADWDGLQGFFVEPHEVDRLAGALVAAPAPEVA